LHSLKIISNFDQYFVLRGKQQQKWLAIGVWVMVFKFRAHKIDIYIHLQWHRVIVRMTRYTRVEELLNLFFISLKMIALRVN
jgi:hypothetical protein